MADVSNHWPVNRQERPMTCTVWLRGQQIGESGFECEHDRLHRAGAFHPTAFGLSVLPSITAMGPALFAFGDLCKREGLDTETDDPVLAASAFETFVATQEGRRVMAAAHQIAGIEVRDSEGKTITWESLAITDLDWMVAEARRRNPSLLRAVDAMPPHDPIKYMISLTLAEHQDGVTSVRLPGGMRRPPVRSLH
jgi:hypothetical protein